RNAPPLEVASAFGGLGIYKLPDVLRNKRIFVGHKSKPMAGPDGSFRQVGWQVCEDGPHSQGSNAGGGILPAIVRPRAPAFKMIVSPSSGRVRCFCSSSRLS